MACHAPSGTGVYNLPGHRRKPSSKRLLWRMIVRNSHRSRAILSGETDNHLTVKTEERIGMEVKKEVIHLPRVHF